MKRKLLGLLTRALVPPFKRKRSPSKLVAVVVPMTNRSELLPDEEISLRHLRQFLGNYDKFLVAPAGMNIMIDGIDTKKFPARFFGSAAAHNRLLGSPEFYNQFLDYEYIFFYHLDSLAFSDQLAAWCGAGWDYIGPPFMNCEATPWVKEPRVGNGGFTLLRVESALKVIHNRHRQQPLSFWLDLFTRHGSQLQPAIRCMEKIYSCFPGSSILRRVLDEWRWSEQPNNNSRNNDMFWSDHARRYLPQFKVATFEEGLRFAFEAAPRKCLEINGGRMPFGCHAWGRYDREFWSAHLLSDAS